MKLTIERSSLLKSLGHVHSVVERRNTIPILSNVLLDAGDGRLSLTATDLDLAIVEATEAHGIEPGATTVPAHTLYDIVRKLPDGAEVSLSLDDNQRLTIEAGRSSFKLACLPRDDFPSMTDGELPHNFALPAVELKRLIDKTRFAISTEETRYYLNGIYLHVAQGSDGPVLRAVATDGHRLAQADTVVPDGAAEMPGVIVPRKTVGEIRKLIDEFEGDVAVALSDTKIRFGFGQAVVTSKLIDGTFPDYSRVIPKGNEKELSLDCRAFANAVDRVSTISTDKSRAVKLSLGDDSITLSVTSPENGTATEELAAAYQAEAMDIGFNSRYLLDILGQVEGDTVAARLASPDAPTVVTDEADQAALYVLMPMRV
ncbi:DNA polymerase III subunit beta [Rhodothalassium salexigens]|uniref:DNA polymerase III subunit beta n=1 Tax=Rhodothalassium salexigens TaxID=1086 RepID=UPI0019122DBA|nr:DNA polymerase III subunit beta [Rhodothalassium salexigens]MBK5912136.1 DNA polymerase III subunit beta [Rhodothalassium salexigens]MBK5921816.1 DNA polymerase III subunit beta [Rhodothalassium salexigens]